jgi:hypothetical protein
MNVNLFKIEAAVCRWAARALGAVLVFITIMIAIGQRMPNPFTQPIVVQIGFLALALIVGGILAAWRWELWGGLVSLFGWVLFFTAVIGPLRGLNGFVAALALPGVLYVASAVLRNRGQKRLSA